MHSQSPSTNLKRCLYITLIRSKLSYCSQLWRPHLIKHIKMLENIQRRATKFITLNHEADYKQRLIQSNLLPLMYWLELQDILFLVKCLQNPSDNFNIRNFVTFTSSCTRSTSSNKLRYNYCRSTTTRHFYFNRIVRLWNALPHINLSLPYINIKKFIYSYFWSLVNLLFIVCTFVSLGNFVSAGNFISLCHFISLCNFVRVGNFVNLCNFVRVG